MHSGTADEVDKHWLLRGLPIIYVDDKCLYFSSDGVNCVVQQDSRIHSYVDFDSDPVGELVLSVTVPAVVYFGGRFKRFDKPAEFHRGGLSFMDARSGDVGFVVGWRGTCNWPQQ